tara:strand:+ start:5780 stop:7804 length:2025 start_codon:yes stop_codon:yes gene_type:complete
MSHTWLVRLPPRLDDRSRVDDAASTAGLRGGVVAEKPLAALGETRLDCARLDPEDRRHAAAVERGGIVRSMRTGGRTGSGVERFQLHTEAKDGELKPVHRAWRQFEFIPKQQAGAVLISQMGSPNLLYSTLPADGGETGSMVFLFGSHNAAVSAFQVSPDGTMVVSGAEDGSLAVWRVADGEKVGSISAAHRGGVRAVAIASATCVMSSGNDGSVRVWQVSDDPRLRMLHRMTPGDAPAPLTALATWSAPANDTRQLLAAGSADGVVYTWTADASGNSTDFGWRAASVSHHMAGMEISHVSFRGDGASLLAGSGESHHAGKGEVRLFETEHWTSIATVSYTSGVVGCEYSRSLVTVDLAMVCSSAGAPRMFESRLTPSVTALLREQGLGADIPPQPLGHGPLPSETNRDGSGIRFVSDVGEFQVSRSDLDDASAAEHEPRAAPPPTPSAKTKPMERSKETGVRRPAFSRSGKYHHAPDTTPSERATRVVAKMAAKVMAKAPEMDDSDEDDEEELDDFDHDDMLGGVTGAETDLAKPSLMSSRPLLHRNALIPFAVFDKDAELQHHMAPLGLTGKKEAAAVADTHVRAMAAANMDLSLPRNGRRFEGLTAIPQEPPKTAKRMVTKQLDPRWLAVRDIKPRMEDIWVAARREPQVCSTEGWNSGTLLVPPSQGVEF